MSIYTETEYWQSDEPQTSTTAQPTSREHATETASHNHTHDSVCPLHRGWICWHHLLAMLQRQPLHLNQILLKLSKLTNKCMHVYLCLSPFFFS